MTDLMSLLGQKSTQTPNAIGDKDPLAPPDITVIKEEGKEVYHAYIGLVPYTGVIAQPPKFYRATATTAEEAKRSLVLTLKEQLDRAIT